MEKVVEGVAEVERIKVELAVEDEEFVPPDQPARPLYDCLT